MEDKKEWIGWRILDAIGKIIIPLLLAVIAYQQNTAASARDETSKREQRDAALRERQIKYIELVWSSVIGTDERAKLLAMKLLKSMDSATAATISSAVSQDTTQPEAVRKAASDAVTNTSLYTLKGFNIDIFLMDGPGLEHRRVMADSIAALIQQQNLGNRVRIRSYNETSLHLGQPRGDEVRFDSEGELASAQALAALLNSQNLSWNFQLRKVQTSTPGYLSIIIP